MPLTQAEMLAVIKFLRPAAEAGKHFVIDQTDELRWILGTGPTVDELEAAKPAADAAAATAAACDAARAWYAGELAAGYQHAGLDFRIPGTEDAKMVLSERQTAYGVAAAAGTLTAESPVLLLDTDGNDREVTYANWTAAAVGYMEWQLSTYQEYRTRLQAASGAP